VKDLVFDVIDSQSGAELNGISFFNSNKFLYNRKIDGKPIRFNLFQSDPDIILASMHIGILSNRAFSPLKAPYGSIECSYSINSLQLDYFLKELVKWLKENKINSLEVIQYPDFYFVQNSQLTEKTILENGFQLLYSDLNQFINVSGLKFQDIVSAGKKQRIRKCLQKGFISGIEDNPKLDEAYDLLTNARNRKGYSVSMGLEELNEMFRRHTENYLLFTVKDGERVIAMALCIVINEKIIYDFCHAEHEDYMDFSPVLLVMNAVYAYCYEHAFHFIDLGTSGKAGNLNQGVFNFKKELGAEESRKKQFLWENKRP